MLKQCNYGLSSIYLERTRFILPDMCRMARIGRDEQMSTLPQLMTHKMPLAIAQVMPQMQAVNLIGKYPPNEAKRPELANADAAPMLPNPKHKALTP